MLSIHKPYSHSGETLPDYLLLSVDAHLMPLAPEALRLFSVSTQLESVCIKTQPFGRLVNCRAIETASEVIITIDGCDLVPFPRDNLWSFDRVEFSNPQLAEELELVARVIWRNTVGVECWSVHHIPVADVVATQQSRQPSLTAHIVDHTLAVAQRAVENGKPLDSLSVKEIVEDAVDGWWATQIEFKPDGLVEYALRHVARLHPSVTQVIYDEELRWCYTDDAGHQVVFEGDEDIDLLESAADEAYSRGLILKVIKLKHLPAGAGA